MVYYFWWIIEKAYTSMLFEQILFTTTCTTGEHFGMTEIWRVETTLKTFYFCISKWNKMLNEKSWIYKDTYMQSHTICNRGVCGINMKMYIVFVCSTTSIQYFPSLGKYMTVEHRRRLCKIINVMSILKLKAQSLKCYGNVWKWQFCWLLFYVPAECRSKPC